MFLRTLRPLVEQWEIIRTPLQLSAAVANLNKRSILWIELRASDVSIEEVARLRAWIEQGGVLWLDTDFARTFGFVLEAQGGDLEARCIFERTHAATSRLKGMRDASDKVEFALKESWLVRTVKDADSTWLLTTIRAGVRPNKLSPEDYRAACAEMRPKGSKGKVFYRPRLVRDSEGIEHFEYGLFTYGMTSAAN